MANGTLTLQLVDANGNVIGTNGADEWQPHRVTPFTKHRRPSTGWPL